MKRLVERCVRKDKGVSRSLDIQEDFEIDGKVITGHDWWQSGCRRSWR